MCLTLRSHVEPEIARLSSSYVQFSGDVLLGSSIKVVPMDRMMEVLAQVQPGDALRLVQENLHQPMTGDPRWAPLLRHCGGTIDLLQRHHRHHR